jgi:hypothetical protein
VDQVVQLLVAVVAPGLVALEVVEEDRVGVEDRVVAPRPEHHRRGLVVLDARREDGVVADVVLLRADAGLRQVGHHGLAGLLGAGFDDRRADVELDVEAVRESGVGQELLARGMSCLYG